MYCLADSVRYQAAHQPDKKAFICEDRALTFADVNTESSKVANALSATGIKGGDRVGFIGKGCPEYFTLCYGAAKLNAVMVGVNIRLAPAEMEFIVNDAEAKVLVVDVEFLDHLAKMQLPRDLLIITFGGQSQYTNFSAWIADMPSDDPKHAANIEDTAFQFYTSGTTGTPKGVEVSNRNLESLVEAFRIMNNVRSDSIFLQILPVFHIAGIASSLVFFHSGCTNIVHSDFIPQKIFEDIPRYKVTLLGMVPAMLQVLPTLPNASDVDFSSLEKVFYGASPITEDVLRASLKLLQCDHGQMYGLSESGIVSHLEPEDHDPDGPRTYLLRSAGKPAHGAEIKIVDTDGKEVPDGEVGEIWTRSSQNMKGYWKNPEATEKAFPEGRDENGFGWLATGDAGYMKDGYLFIHDRVKDMIISGGENVYPAELENVIMSHPAVADVAVIGIPSDRWGETPLALVVPAEGKQPDQEDIINYCSERLAKYKLPTVVEKVEQIPRNPTGKILKVELRKPYWEGRDRSVN